MRYIKMSIALGVLTFFLISLLMPLPLNAEVRSLSLEEAIELSLKNNPELTKGNLELEKAEIMRDEAAQGIHYTPVEGVFSPEYQALYSGYQQAQLTVRTKKRALQVEEDKIANEVISAYASAIRNYNVLQKANLQYNLVDKQNTIASLSRKIGIISDHSYEGSKLGKKQLQETVRLAESNYEGSIAELRRLLGQNPNWEVKLISRPIINNYPRHELSTEINRGTSESMLVWTKEFLVGLEEIKQKWVMPYTDRQIQDIDLSVAEIDYEDAKRTVRTTIEQLYYTIDTIEGQIQVAELNCEKTMRDLEIAELKYELGLITLYSQVPGSESLSNAKLEAQKAKLELEDLQATLVELKANYAFLTGQGVYSADDWSNATPVETANVK